MLRISHSYAFAAATAYSARMCGKTEEKWNIVASPQEMMDCSNGCDGGWPLSLYESIANEKSSKVVEKFCDPYVQVDILKSQLPKKLTE